MKRTMIAAFALLVFSAAGMAQTAPASKKKDAAKMHIVTSSNVKTMPATRAPAPAATKTVVKTKVTPAPAITKTAVVKTKVTPAPAPVKPAPATAKTATVVAKPKVTTTAAVTKVPLKKDGTPDKRYKVTSTATAGPVKKDGTPDKRFSANKKHS